MHHNLQPSNRPLSPKSIRRTLLEEPQSGVRADVGRVVISPVRTRAEFLCAVLLITTSLAYAGSPSDYASQVVEYVPGDGIGFDFISGEPFDNPMVALGPPTVDTTGDGFDIPLEQQVPLVPPNSAFRAFEIVSIGIGGHLTLMFDGPVENDQCNPYGVDFIVFGNSFQVSSGGQGWLNGDPNDTILGGALFSEPALVSVSEDGKNWFTFVDGPFADDFAPTLGRIYDPENADHSVFPLNEWWAQPTDPTKPLDPAVVASASNLAGNTVAEAAVLYSGSAGGTGFDIGELGLDWIQYVRIEQSGSSIPEIDAVADVASESGSETGPDLNGDGVVDPIDLAILLGSWGPCDCCLADLNGDDMVGPVDLATLLGSWG